MARLGDRAKLAVHDRTTVPSRHGAVAADARLQAVTITAGMEETQRSILVREQGVFFTDRKL